MKISVKNTREETVVVSYLAVFGPGEVKEFREEDLMTFYQQSGVPLSEWLPDGVIVAHVEVN